MDVKVELWRKLSSKELMLLNCGVGEDSWESLGLQGDPKKKVKLLLLPSLHSKGALSWDFFGRNDAKAETPGLWPPDAKSWLIGKDSDAGRDWGQEEKGTTEDEMAVWHHWLDGCESGWTLGVGDGQGGLACCNSWGRKESDMTELIWMMPVEANICWIMEKAREFQKNIYFCFIDYTKTFDYVDHNKLWKILKEVEIPDHLTCLLRNLYAGKEATVGTGHGTTDWFQTGKGVHQGCILSLCLYNLHASCVHHEYIMWNAGLDEAQAGIKIAGRNISNPRYVAEKAMVPHSSTLAWKIPWMEEPGRLQPMGLLRVRHDWATSLSLFTFMHWRRKWLPTPVFLPGESQGRGSLVGCRLWGRTESDMTEVT